LAIGNEDGNVRIWDVQTGALQKTLSGQHSKWIVRVLAPSPDIVISSSQDPLVVVWNVHLGEPRHILQGSTDTVQDMVQSEDLLFGGARDGAVYVWNLATGQQVHILQDHLNRSVGYVALNPDESLLATALSGGGMGIWDVSSGYH
ncbi:WD40 repeat-like protein, partial [Lophiostoma macrostomum CBS 122681]